MKLQIVAFVALASALLPGCEQSPSGELPDFCLSPSDCQYLASGECRMADCVDGQCVVVDDASANGTACGMSDACVAVAGTCDDGACVGAIPVVCPEVECMSGQCDGAVGKCVYTPGPEGTDCDIDGNPCTHDSCADGLCVPGENRCPCKGDYDCPEIQDMCLGRYQCAPSGCVIEPLSVVTCPDPGPCEEFVCDPDSGNCERAMKPDGTICARADSCSTGGICEHGVCGATPRCGDDNPCTDDLCDPATGACSFVANQSSCDDGDACTDEGNCVGGTCVAASVSCDDGNDCTLDGCHKDSGCTNTPVLPGTGCLSLDPCVTATFCDDGGVCGGGIPACDDGNECTHDTCAPGSGECGHVNVAGACDDRNPCTVGEQCVSGVCGAGAAMPGCCNFDADCDDGDACTPTRCIGQRCWSSGQDPESCPASTAGCALDWCDARTGQCAAIDAGIPVVMAAWNFGGQPQTRGFVWGEPAGVLSGGGLSAADADRAVFLLPRRLVPEGLVMAFVGVVSGGCGSIQFSKTPDRTGCIADGGVDWVAAAFMTADASDASSRLDVEVSVAAGAIVSDVYVYLWHSASCGSDSIVVGDVAVSDISMSVGMGETAIVANTGSAIAGTVVVRDGRVIHKPLAQEPFAVMAGRFSTSLARSGGRYMAAWGGADDEVRFASFDSSAWGAIGSVPDIGADGQIEAWPALAAVDGGGWAMAFSYGDGTDFDIAVAGLDKAGAVVNDYSRLNDSIVGTRLKPKLLMNFGYGLAAWIAEIQLPSFQNLVVFRKLDLNGEPVGFELTVSSSYSELSALSVAQVGDKYFCVWQQVDGVVGGAVVDVETLSVSHTFSFGDAADPNSRPLILPFGDGAVAVSIQGIGAAASIVYRTVSADGTVADPVTIVSPVLAVATNIAAGRFGPRMFQLAWTDHLGVPDGLRLKVFSPLCPSGFLDSGVACTGLADGPDGGVPE